MKVLFHVEYRTVFGEELVLNILSDEAEGKVSQHKMTTLDGLHWFAEQSLVAESGTHIDYYYSVMRSGKEARHEWLMEPHRLEFAAQKAVCYTVYDHWLDIPDDAYMYSSAFTECVLARHREMSTKTEYRRTVRLKVRAPQLRVGERLAVVGDPEALGAWNPRKALPMTEHEYHEWVVSLDAEHLPWRFEFKFVVVDEKDDVAPIWEQGMNRTFEMPAIDDGEVIVYELAQAAFPICPWKGAGTVIPIFSLRSEGSFGVGDFGDLKLLVDWAKKTGQRVI